MRRRRRHLPNGWMYVYGNLAGSAPCQANDGKLMFAWRQTFSAGRTDGVPACTNVLLHDEFLVQQAVVLVEPPQPSLHDAVQELRRLPGGRRLLPQDSALRIQRPTGNCRQQNGAYGQPEGQRMTGTGGRPTMTTILAVNNWEGASVMNSTSVVARVEIRNGL